MKKKRSLNDLDHVDQTCRHTDWKNVMNDSVFIEEMRSKTRCLTKVWFYDKLSSKYAICMVEVTFCLLSVDYQSRQKPSERSFQHQKGKNGACSRMQIRTFSPRRLDCNFALVVFTWYQGDFHAGTSSLQFPLVALYSVTWHQHKIAQGNKSYRFTPVTLPERDLQSG